MLIEIIPFEDKYASQVYDINQAVSTHPNRPPKDKAFARYLYVDYYLTMSKENCFIALDTNKDLPAGYILCEPNLERFKHQMLDIYALEAEKLNPIYPSRLANEIAPFEKWHDQYDAHMHIDISPDYQHQGIGSRLLEKEFSHLKEIGCKGILLQVAKDNKNANAFYEKNGIKIIDEFSGFIRGKKL